LDGGLVPPDPEPFHCEVDPHRGAVHVRPVGELDLATVPEVDAQLNELQTAGFKQLTLDLGRVCFLDLTGLRMILEWDARSRADGFAFKLIPGSPTVQRLFDLTGTRERLDFLEASGARAAA